MGPRVSARGARRVTSSGSCSVDVSNGRHKTRRNRGNINVGGNRSSGNRRKRNQQRCASFRRRSEISRKIRLIDEYGNEQYVLKYGKLGITKHTGVMSALEKRALRYRRGACREDEYDKALYQDALDETGTVNTEALIDSDDESSEDVIQRVRYEEIKGVKDDLMRVHGVAPGVKPEGCSRLVYENTDGLRNNISGNDKLDKAKEVIDELQADIVAINEHKLNLKHKRNKNGLSQMFNGGETDIRTVAGHNVHENVGKVQQGGTGLLLYGPLCQQLQFDESGAEDTGMGRWVVMTLQGEDGFKTRVVSAYNPCYNKKKDSGTVYQQQRRALITKFKDTSCPRKRFRRDLAAQLNKWREEGDRIIVAMDANENIYRKSIGKMLTDSAGLNMKEVVGEFTKKKLGATFFRGSTPIDAVWATSDITVVGACVMPVGYGVGDHRMFIIDFLTSSLIGTDPVRVVRPAARRLNTRLARGVDKYVDKVEDGIIRHRLVERVQDAYLTSMTEEQLRYQLNKIDRQRKELKLHAEKKCRRISSGRIPFSEEASIWIRRLQVYRSLLKYHAGKVTNRGNLKRAARRCKIYRPMHSSVEDLRARIKAAKDKCKYFRRHGQKYRRNHLDRCLLRAQNRKDEEAEKKILAIIQREKQRSFWRAQNMAMGKKKGSSVRTVQTSDEEGQVTEHRTQESITEAIFENIHRQRFYLAERAPICKGQMREDFGYLAMSPVAKAILDGTYLYPDYFDQATKELCEECARYRQRIEANSVSSDIRIDRWQERWSRANENTSSSESGLHFSHYIAGAESDIISGLDSILTSVALRKGIALERWSRGLSVMLEKMFGCSLVNKLRSILLMEADFNWANKEIFGIRMMNNVRDHNLMCDEIYSEKGRMADDGGLAKVLFNDIVRQSRLPACIASVDAAQCYDSIAHAIASLVFQAFGVPDGAIKAMLTAIQEMKYFLRTAFGDSKDFAGSSLEVKFQGLCQGNGAAPAGFAVISITILHAHKRKGHGTVIKCPITNKDGHLAAILFVDDCDLLHLRMDRNETVQEAHQAMQESMTNWGKLLIATGGSLKPEKCFSYVISFEWDRQGRWRYQSNEQYEESDLYVPLQDGSSIPIDNLPVTECRETLGMFSSPSGNNKGSIKKMQDKAQEWIDTAKNRKITRRSVWFMGEVQFWPGVKYGLCANTASYSELSNCLQKQYYQMLPLGGVIRTCYTPLRQLDRGFYGVGCPHPGIECLVEQADKLLMHFGCRTGVGLKFQCSWEFLVLELGISSQPLNESYSRYSSWVTHSWLKSFWEKTSKFDISVEVNNFSLPAPRQGDKWLMRCFQDAGFNADELLRLNRVRIHQQALFFSCVLGAGGKSLDKRYLVRRKDEEQWSTLKFPQERPPQRDFALWKRALFQLCPSGSVNDRLGRWTTQGSKIWPWRFDTGNDRLLVQTTPSTMDIYTKSFTQGGQRTRTNRYTRTYVDEPLALTGELCSVEEAGLATVKRVSQSLPPIPKPPPESFIEVLEEWDFLWMWDDLNLQGDAGWLEESIRDNSLVAVTDGSYIKEMYPDLCSAAFVIICSKGRGRLSGSFAETSQAACAYRGELMGVMAIHLILLSVNKVNPNLQGLATVVCDCLGALNKVETLPPDRIPSRSKHSDILKNIMINCSNISFVIKYEHVEAHQDDHKNFEDLTFHSQLNCVADYKAQQRIRSTDPFDQPGQEPFPLEPICMMVEGEKITSSTGQAIRFHAHQQAAAEIFSTKNILYTDQFYEVDWHHVFAALHEVPRMFQIWASKQVHNIAATNYNLVQRGKRDCPLCPSCMDQIETAAHILSCKDAGRVEALLMTIDLMGEWLEEKGTDPILLEILIEYAKGRGAVTMEEICWDKQEIYKLLAVSQDKIGWRRFMEGMISKEFGPIQWRYLTATGSSLSLKKWTTGLITRLLEVTHGQWLYRNVQVHDDVTGVNASLRKEEIIAEIEKQQETGEEGLLPEDRYLLEINLDDMEITSGEKQEYWLLAIRAARVAYTLRSRRTRRERSTATAEQIQAPVQELEEEQEEEEVEVVFQSPPSMRRVAVDRAEVVEVESESDDDSFMASFAPPRVSRVTEATENHNIQRRDDI